MASVSHRSAAQAAQERKVSDFQDDATPKRRRPCSAPPSASAREAAKKARKQERHTRKQQDKLMAKRINEGEWTDE